MEQAYHICLLIGIIVPVVMLLIGGVFHVFDGFLDGLTDGFDFDLNIDIGDTCISLLPFSIYSICSALLVFGTIGSVMYNGSNLILTNVVGGVSAYVAAVAVQSLIKRLKNEKHTTYSKDELLLFDAKVVNTILPGAYGSISITTYDGISSTYPAKAEDPSIQIKALTIVRIVRFDGHTAIVTDADLTKKYDTVQEQSTNKQ